MNPTTVHYLNVVLGLGAILLQIASVVALLVLFFGPKRNKYLDYLDKHFLPFSFFIALTAWLVLVYSEIVHYLPCYLCWWQRVFMFPLAPMFGVALWDKDRKVVRFALPLLVLGLAFSVYQNFFYYFGESNAPCDATGVSCYQHLVSEFGGYISIPMLSLTGFVSMLTLMAVVRFYNKQIR